MKIKGNPIYKPNNFQMDTWQVEKVIDLPTAEFDEFVTLPLRDYPFIAENKEFMYSEGGVIHGLLVLGQNRSDGVLIDAEGYNYARYASYLAGARDIVNAEISRAVDFIVRQGTEHTGSGSWCVYFEELEEKLGLRVQEGNGFDAMLRDALYRRDEVIGMKMDNGCVDTNYHPAFCKHLEEPGQSMGPMM